MPRIQFTLTAQPRASLLGILQGKTPMPPALVSAMAENPELGATVEAAQAMAMSSSPNWTVILNLIEELLPVLLPIITGA